MVTFIDAHRGAYGVEPICEVLPIAPATYHAHKARQTDVSRLPARAVRDERLKAQIRRVWTENRGVYDSRKVSRQLQREGLSVARCTVERLMRELNLQGAARGRRLRTTVPDGAADRPQDLVERNFTTTSPNQLWLADLTYVATWRGFVYVAFVVDAFARRIVGWRVTQTLRTDLVLDALEQVLNDRPLGAAPQLVHHSDRGVSTFRFATPNVWPRRGSSPRSAAAATRMTTPWPSRSSVSTRPRSSTDVDRGARSKRSN